MIQRKVQQEIAAVCGATSLWKLALIITMLVAFAAIGIECVVNPDWGIKHLGRALLGGGELRREWNRLGISFVGIAFGGFVLYGLCVVLRDCF